MRTSLLALLAAGPLAAQAPVDYTRDVRPILADACFACHGADEKARKAKLRLDVRDAAVQKAIVPGKGKDSPLVQRVTSTDAEEVMPPAHAKKPAVTPRQAELLARWIDQGAKYDLHWAYAKPVRPEVPAADNPWVRNPVDAFVAWGLATNGFTPAPAADQVTLLRRLSFDLTGLPPTPAQVDAFTKDTSTDAYANLVDRLLASKHFGERLAVMWLDAVRYADTAGYHSDNHRDVYLFRDYVIAAFNTNKPFDRFTVEQLAGDLLPSPTPDQRVASGYNKMLMTTEEGGAQAKEYTAKYVADRVRNASNAWLGATLGCAECHDHKFDPFRTKDFYAFGAFFADVSEVPVGRQPQTALPTPEQDAELKKLDAELARLKGAIAKTEVAADGQAKWEADAKKAKGLPKPVADALAVEPEKRTDAHKKAIAQHYRDAVAPETAAARKDLVAATAKRDAMQKTIPTTLVAMSGAPRTVRVLPRGNWLDETGEVVSPAIPAFLGSIDRKDRASRLDLATWVASPDNPLTARVFVNRLWKVVFGQGLVRNLDDFGTQGTPPSHPELLDWLATEFVRTGWDVKALLQLLVTSNAYRQSSAAPKAVRDRDPGNVWLARQNRFRLDAEFVRDNALAVAGLLTTKVGGPSAKPYQPDGYWDFLNFPKRQWEADTSADQYRRGLYTYWCRSFLHPSLAAFDAPSREECTNERPRSSTPVQALVLLNDPTYVEAARVFAATAVGEGKTTAGRVDAMFRRALSRPATAAEMKLLDGLVAKHLADFRADPAGATKLLGVGLAPLPAGVEPAELAAWTSVARVVLNLHEAVTRN